MFAKICQPSIYCCYRAMVKGVRAIVANSEGRKNIKNYKDLRNWVLATKLNFPTPIYWQPDWVNLWYFKHTTLGCKDKGIRKSEFDLAKTQFLRVNSVSIYCTLYSESQIYGYVARVFCNVVFSTYLRSNAAEKRVYYTVVGDNINIMKTTFELNFD